ncbi:MAG: DUF2007 domain-containing protein [bacterium]
MNREPVVIRRYTTVIEAQLAQSYLESFGISSYVMKDDAGGFHPHLQQAIGVKLMIAGDDEEAAGRLLDAGGDQN